MNKIKRNILENNKKKTKSENEYCLKFMPCSNIAIQQVE